MKDIILVTAYCPDYPKEQKLRKLVTQLSKFKDTFDVMVVSHTPIPSDIQKNVNLCLFDDKNELLTDWDLICQPWFSPNNDRRIQSGLLSGRNTHLAIFRMLILSFSLLKNIGYKKVHVIEYDSEINNIDELKDNGKLLDSYDSVYYIENSDITIDEILFGSTFSFHIDKLPDSLLILDEDEIKNTIRNSRSKGPEKITRKLIEKSGNYFQKNAKVLHKGGNKFATSEEDDGFNAWGVPFIDLLDDCVYFIVWNNSKLEGVRYTIIVNNDSVFTTGLVPMGHWKLIKIDNIKDINKILTMENDKVRDNIKFNSTEDRKLFRKISFREKQIR